MQAVFCWWLREAVSAAGPSRAQARDSLSIVLSPLLLLARMDEPAAASLAAGSTGKPTPPQRQFAGCDHGTWPLRVTRRQLLYRRSPIGGDARCSAAQTQAAPAPARHGKIRPAGTWSLRPSRPAMPGRSAPRRGAHLYHAPSISLRDGDHSYMHWHGCCFAMPRTTLGSLSRSRHG
jgi:hypothetical protein